MVKKNFSIFLIFILIHCSYSYAQTKVGLQIGGDFSKPSIKSDTREKDKVRKPGISVGASLNFKLLPFLSFQPEFIYCQKGIKYKGDTIIDLCGIYVEQTTMNYVEIPLTFKLKSRLFPFYISLGGYLAYCIEGEFKLDANNRLQKEPIEFNERTYSRFDFGLNAGIGILKEFPSTQFFVETRYIFGMYNIDNSNNTIYNRNFRICCGILMRMY